MEHKGHRLYVDAIGPHTDGTYSFDAPGYQMFHCLGLDCVGGDSVLVDGFEIAAIMKREMPDLYRVLTEVEVTGQYMDHEKGIHLMAKRPVFRLDSAGKLVQVSFNHLDRAPLFLPEFELKAFYRAYGAFARLAQRRGRCNTGAGWSRARWSCSTTGAAARARRLSGAIAVSPGPISTRKTSRAGCGCCGLAREGTGGGGLEQRPERHPRPAG